MLVTRSEGAFALLTDLGSADSWMSAGGAYDSLEWMEGRRLAGTTANLRSWELLTNLDGVPPGRNTTPAANILTFSCACNQSVLV